MNDEFSAVTDHMRSIAMRLYNRVLQAPGERGALKVLAAWIRQDGQHRLALKELQQFLEIIPDDPAGLLNRMVGRLAPIPTLH